MSGIRSSTDKEPYVLFTSKMKVALHDKIREVVFRERKKIQTVINEAVEFYLREKGYLEDET